MTEWAGLEIRKAACPLRGFESLSLRNKKGANQRVRDCPLFYTQESSFIVSIPKSFNRYRRASADTVVTVLTLRTKS